MKKLIYLEVNKIINYRQLIIYPLIILYPFVIILVENEYSNPLTALSIFTYIFLLILTFLYTCRNIYKIILAKYGKYEELIKLTIPISNVLILYISYYLSFTILVTCSNSPNIYGIYSTLVELNLMNTLIIISIYSLVIFIQFVFLVNAMVLICRKYIKRLKKTLTIICLIVVQIAILLIQIGLMPNWLFESNNGTSFGGPLGFISMFEDLYQYSSSNLLLFTIMSFSISIFLLIGIFALRKKNISKQ